MSNMHAHAQLVDIYAHVQACVFAHAHYMISAVRDDLLRD